MTRSAQKGSAVAADRRRRGVGFTWDHAYVVDGAKFVHRFGFTPTPFEVAVLETVRDFVEARMQVAPKRVNISAVKTEFHRAAD